MNTVLATPGGTQVLGHFPDSIAELPQPHRVILALIVAHRETVGEAISWQHLLDSAVAAISSELPGARTLSDHNILRTVTSVVGDLFDYDLLAMGAEGLSLSDRAEKARYQWNGDFTLLVDGAKEIVNGCS